MKLWTYLLTNLGTNLQDMGGNALETSQQYDTFGFTAAEHARKQASKEQNERLASLHCITDMKLRGCLVGYNTWLTANLGLVKCGKPHFLWQLSCLSQVRLFCSPIVCDGWAGHGIMQLWCAQTAAVNHMAFIRQTCMSCGKGWKLTQHPRNQLYWSVFFTVSCTEVLMWLYTL